MDNLTFYGQFEPPTDKILYERYFKDKQNGVIIEAGAFDGITENNSYFFEKFLNWRCINVEPFHVIYNELIINRPNSINYNIGLSDKNDKQTFKIFNHKVYGYKNTNGSFNHVQSHLDDLITWDDGKFEEYEYNIITYNDLINDLHINHNITEIDCFVLDVEGYEFNVIDGMKNCPILPKVFMIEYPHIGLDNLKNKIEEVFPNIYSFDTVIHNNAYFLQK